MSVLDGGVDEVLALTFFGGDVGGAEAEFRELDAEDAVDVGVGGGEGVEDRGSGAEVAFEEGEEVGGGFGEEALGGRGGGVAG